jgi:hypothetical protein
MRAAEVRLANLAERRSGQDVDDEEPFRTLLTGQSRTREVPTQRVEVQLSTGLEYDDGGDHFPVAIVGGCDRRALRDRGVIAEDVFDLRRGDGLPRLG